MVLGIHSCLHVVAHHGRSFDAVGGHGACIWVCLGDLPLAQLPLRLDHLQALQPQAHLLDLFMYSFGLSLHLCRLSPICRFKGVEVTLDAFLQLPFTAFNLPWPEVALGKRPKAIPASGRSPARPVWRAGC